LEAIDLQETVDMFQKENETLSSKIDSSTEQLVTVQNANSQLKIELARLKEVHGLAVELQKQLTKIKGEKDELEIRITALDKTQASCDELDEKLEALEAAATENKKESNQSKVKLAEMEEALKTERMEITSKSSLNADLQEKLDYINKENAKLVQVNQAITNKVDIQSRELESLLEQNRCHLEELKHLENKLVVVKSGDETGQEEGTEVDNLRILNKRLIIQVSDLRQYLNNVELQHCAMQEDLQNEIKILSTEMHDKEVDKEKMTRIIDDLSHKNAEIEAKK